MQVRILSILAFYYHVIFLNFKFTTNFAIMLIYFFIHSHIGFKLEKISCFIKWEFYVST